MSQPELEPDHTLDYYVIDFWSHDGRYRLTRQRISGGRKITDYLSRDAGGQLAWAPDLGKAESWEAVQSAAVCLVHCLNQHGVIG